jgi:plastocyanin domain-containing protein
MRKIVTVLMLFSLSFLSLAIAKDPEKRYVAKIDADGVQRVEVLGGSYFFDPNHIIVKVNVPVEFKVRKEGGITPHNIVLKAPEAGMDFDTSMSKDAKGITFTPKKTGIFHFSCSKKLLFMESHREKGMEGVLEVVE